MAEHAAKRLDRFEIGRRLRELANEARAIDEAKPVIAKVKSSVIRMRLTTVLDNWRVQNKQHAEALRRSLLHEVSQNADNEGTH